MPVRIFCQVSYDAIYIYLSVSLILLHIVAHLRESQLVVAHLRELRV
jgi:hypothetical protein